MCLLYVTNEIAMKLTFIQRVKICFEVLFVRSGHAHTAQEKQLSVFQNGYAAGIEDREARFRTPLKRIKHSSSERPNAVYLKKLKRIATAAEVVVQNYWKYINEDVAKDELKNAVLDCKGWCESKEINDA